MWILRRKSQQKNLPGSYVSLARSKERQQGKIIFHGCLIILQSFMETVLFGDDPALVGGIAYLAGKPVTVIVQEKGNGTKRILPIILAWFLRKVTENPYGL